MEHYEWMNDQARQEIEDLQRTYGFDEDEALAYWHLRHAGILLLAMRRADAPEIAEEGEESVRVARMIHAGLRSSRISCSISLRFAES